MSAKVWLTLLAVALVALAVAGWIASGIRRLVATAIGLPLRVRFAAAPVSRRCGTAVRRLPHRLHVT
jgi:hypothetical protein